MNAWRWRESVIITVKIVYKKLNHTQLLVKTQPHKLTYNRGIFAWLSFTQYYICIAILQHTCLRLMYPLGGNVA